MVRNVNLNDIPFTFYGDLLGVSDFYNISEKEGYKKLDEFYNAIYDIFHLGIAPTTKIFIFSDSLFITGRYLSDTLNRLGNLYIELLKKQLFFKGAVVQDLLEFDPRLELKNLRKMLPIGDVLYRAVTLEKHAEGIRLVVEKHLAQKILPPELHGISHSYEAPFIRSSNTKHNVLHKIKWTSDLNAYDFLWLDYGLDGTQPLYWINKIKQSQRHANKSAQNHYTETIKFIKRFYLP
jgi:hypothetical protein